MNRKATPILLAVVLVMALLAWVSERSRARVAAAAPHAGTEGATILGLHSGDIAQVRVKRDYWNSFRLARSPDGTWRLVDPSTEPAAAPAVTKLLSALECLTAISVIDLSADDSERHREYGLWKPSVEITVTTAEGEQTLLVGTPTADHKGVYCSRMGRDKVYIVASEALQPLSQDLAAYREEKGGS